MFKDIKKEIRQLKNSGYSRDQIVDILNCSAFTVSKYIDSNITKIGQDIINMRKSGKTLKQIKESLKCSKSTVSKWCSRLDNNEDIKNEIKENKRKCQINKIKNIKKSYDKKQIVKINNRSQRNRSLKRNRRLFMLKKWNNKCCICGYNKSLNALHFHHVKDKLFKISGNNLTRKLDDIIDEFSKCILVCSNCHCEMHDNIIATSEQPKTICQSTIPDNIKDRTSIELTKEVIEKERSWLISKFDKNKLKERINADINLNDLIIKKVSQKEVNKILDMFHYLGPTYKGSIFSFLFYCKSLVVGAAIVSNPVRKLSLDNVCEISRFVITVNHHNLASKCLSLIINEVKKDGRFIRIQAFSDNSIHSGAIYKAANFREFGGTSATYNYDGIHKKTVYEHAKAFGMTEHEYAEFFNLNKVIESGKTKFIYLI